MNYVTNCLTCTIASGSEAIQEKNIRNKFVNYITGKMLHFVRTGLHKIFV